MKTKIEVDIRNSNTSNVHIEYPNEIDDLAYNEYVLCESNTICKQIWTSKKNFVEHRDLFYEYYKKFNIPLRKYKIEKIKNIINGRNSEQPN